MSTTYKIHQTSFGMLVSRVRGLVLRELAIFRQTNARLRVYHRTIAELEALGERQLSDIGVSRCSIRRIACEEAMKITVK